MNWLTKLFFSSIGKKQLMAITGLGLSGFLLGHLSGNMLIYAGPEAFNGYAEWLTAQPFLPLARIGLATIAVLHIALAFNLTMENKNARPTPYYYEDASGATAASRTMILTGILILVYVIIHLFDFTWASHDVPNGLYGLVVAKLSSPAYGLFYMVSMVVLAGHLVHGIQSAFQSLGAYHRRHTPMIQKACIALALAVCAGFAAIPAYLILFKGGA